MIRTKSVHSEIEKQDGLRILTARIRGRGLPANRYDVWMANLGPSEALLRKFQAGKVTWKEFARAFESELFSDAKVDAQNPHIKNHGQKFTLRLLRELSLHQNVTLMCHCAEDEVHCHRHLLERLLKSRKI
jgi:uncharacterized protein YeaO (DUF488 family)